MRTPFPTALFFSFLVWQAINTRIVEADQTALEAANSLRDETAQPDIAVAPRPLHWAELKGEWIVVKSRLNGKPRNSVLGSSLLLDEKELRGTSEIAETRFKHCIDDSTLPWTMTAQDSAGNKFLAIINVRNGVMHFCVVPPGKPRPARFKTTVGDQRSLLILHRKAPGKNQ